MTKDEMIQALALVQGDGCYLDGGEYFDWSTQRGTGEDRIYNMEIGDGTDAVRFEMTRDQMVALHAALTATLLAPVNPEAERIAGIVRYFDEASTT
jgi:hypothetical protein